MRMLGGSLVVLLASVSLAAQSPRIVPTTSASPEALAAFNQGRALTENNREFEAAKHFQEAIALDPKFAMAYADRGDHLPGAQGLQDLLTAQRLAKGLEEAEQLFIDLYYAKRQEDVARQAKDIARLTFLAADDWRVGFEEGDLAYSLRDFKKAAAGYRRAMTTAHTCVAYNNLGYALAMGEQFSDALVAFRRCADASPKEPNPHDSLGEVHLAQGRFDQAEAAFKRALELSPDFVTAQMGLAFARVYRDDWGGGLTTLKNGLAPPFHLADRMEMSAILAWVQLAHDQPVDALATLDALEKEARAQKSEGQYYLVVAPLQRAAIQNELGHYPEAIAAANTALERLGTFSLPGSMDGALKRRTLVRRLWAEAKLGRTDEARKTLEQLKAEATKLTDNAEVVSGLRLAQGAILAASGDLPGAAREYSQCRLFGLSEYSFSFTVKPEDSFCLWQLALVQDQLKDAAGAERTRARLKRDFTRDPLALYVRARLLKAGASAAT